MRKSNIILTAGVVWLMFFGFLSSSHAWTNSGSYIGTFAGNDKSLTTIYDQIVGSAAYTGPTFFISDFEFYAKVEEGDTEVPGVLFITYEPDFKSGLWSTFKPPSISGELLNFYSVKGSNNYALYWENPGSDNGSWSTEHILNGGGNIPAISHFSSFSISQQPTVNPTIPNPEPGTLMLLGLGVGAVVFTRRKVIKR